MFPSEKFDLDNSSLHSSESWSKLIKYLQKPFPVQNTSKPTDFQLKEVEKCSDFASFGIVKDSARKSRKVNDQKIYLPTRNDEISQKLSTTAKIRMAGKQFIEFYSSKSDEISQLNHQFGVPLSDEEAKDIELLLTLLASAEETGQKQFTRARKLIRLCSNMSLKEGNPVERLVYYFSEAIRMKINRLTRDGSESMQMFDLQEALMNIDTCIYAFHLEVPLSQVCQFSSIYTVIENLNKARSIHVIDLEIRTGIQYIVMMQVIASRSEWDIDRITITVIGTISESKIRDTCKRLADFAKSLNIPFSFKIIMVADVLDLNLDLIELEEDEKIAVYAPMFLSTLIVNPNKLEHVMRVIRKINPCVMVVTEVEANHTSPVFVDRFIEALFFYGALFDSMHDCLAHDDMNRKVMESVFYGSCIRNIVAGEGDERTIRHIGVHVWRKFFRRFGMLEMELSEETLSQTKVMMGKFSCGNSCSVVVDGGCFLIEWKSVPIFSVSAWKFM